MRFVLTTLFIFVIAIPIAAQEVGTAPTAEAKAVEARDSESPPWTLSPEARLQRRLNPARQDERRARAIASGDRVSTDTTVLNGSLEPELFLPEELFRVFVREVLVEDPAPRSVWRNEVEQNFSGQLPHDFWKRFDEIVVELEANLREEQRLGRRVPSASGSEKEHLLSQIDHLQSQGCHLRRQALSEARALLPPQQFDRLLYEGVAPNLRVKESRDMGSSLMRWIEEGC